MRDKFGRRSFLMRAGKGLIALPLVSAMAPSLEAERPVNRRYRTSPTSRQSVAMLNVRAFGAVGDGKTKDTAGIQLALDRCSLLGGGEVLVPAGEYLNGALAIRSNTLLRLDGGASLVGSPDLEDYPLTEVRWEGRWVKGYLGFISAMDAEDIGIAGTGKVLGNPAIKGRVDSATGVRHPALLEFTACRNVRVEDCFTSQNDMWSIHPTYCEDVTFHNVRSTVGQTVSTLTPAST